MLAFKITSQPFETLFPSLPHVNPKADTMTTPAVSKARLEVCTNCGYYGPANQRCNLSCDGFCLKVKACMAESKCPANKW